VAVYAYLCQSYCLVSVCLSVSLALSLLQFRQQCVKTVGVFGAVLEVSVVVEAEQSWLANRARASSLVIRLSHESDIPESATSLFVTAPISSKVGVQSSTRSDATSSAAAMNAEYQR